MTFPADRSLYSPFKRSEEAVQRFGEIPNDSSLTENNPFGNWVHSTFQRFAQISPTKLK